MADRLNDSTCVELIIYNLWVLILPTMLSIITFVTAFIETIDQNIILYFIYPNLVDLAVLRTRFRE